MSVHYKVSSKRLVVNIMGIKISIPVNSDICIELIDLIWQNIGIKLKNLYMNTENTLFFGDSIIGYSDIEEHLQLINLGIPRETLDNATKHLTNFDNLSNKQIILAYGINDFCFGNKNNIIKNYTKLIKHFSNKNKIYITSILPVNSTLVHDFKNLKINNDEIFKINKSIEKICSDNNNTFFIDTSRNMYDKFHNLNKDYTTDGIHLSKQGYQLFYNNLTEYFNITSDITMHIKGL